MTGSPTAGDSFDMYNGVGVNVGLQARWILNGDAQSACSMVAGRFGGQAVQFGSDSSPMTAATVVDPTGLSTSVAVGIDVEVPFLFQGATSRGLEICTSGGAVQCGIGITATGQLFTYQGAGGTTLGQSAAGLLVSGTYVRIEAEVVLASGTGGSINVYLNGALVSGATVSGVNTLGAGSGACGVFQMCVHYYNPSGSSAIRFDNFLFNNASASRMGLLRGETLRPASNSSVQWTPSSGANYSCVNGTVVNGTTNVQASTVSDIDKYTIAPLAESPSVIAAVNVVVFASKTDAGTRSINASMTSGSTEADGATFALSTNGQRYDNMQVNDPATSAPWANAAAVDALLVGPKLAA